MKIETYYLYDLRKKFYIIKHPQDISWRNKQNYSKLSSIIYTFSVPCCHRSVLDFYGHSTVFNAHSLISEVPVRRLFKISTSNIGMDFAAECILR